MKNFKETDYPYISRPMRFWIKETLPADVHLMNRDEAKTLRKLMAETKMTEEELRSIKKYRKILSDAQKEGQKSKMSKQARYVTNLMKEVTKELKLAKEHPLVLAKFRELLEKERRSGYFPWYML